MTRTSTLAGLALASTLLLSGCGAVPAFNPGVAARVGDESVSVSTVDDTSGSYCDAVQDQLQGQAIPNSYIRAQVAGTLALRSAADQVMAEYGVEVDSSYQQTIDEGGAQLEGLSAAERDAVVDVELGELYVTAAEIAVGRAVLDGSPSDEEATAAGARVFTDWLADQDIRIDPRFGADIETGTVVLEDSSITYPLSDVAKAGTAAQPDTTAAAALPATQRCG